MKDILDSHTHTIASGHAYSTLHEMAQRRGGQRAGAPRDHRACHGHAGNLP